MKNVADNMYPRIMFYRPSPRGWLCEIMLHATYSEVFGPYKHVEDGVKEALRRLDLKEKEDEG